MSGSVNEPVRMNYAIHCLIHSRNSHQLLTLFVSSSSPIIALASQYKLVRRRATYCLVDFFEKFFPLIFHLVPAPEMPKVIVLEAFDRLQRAVMTES